MVSPIWIDTLYRTSDLLFPIRPQSDRMMTYQDAPDEIDDLFKLIIQSGHGTEINTSVYDTLGFFLPDYDIVPPL